MRVFKLVGSGPLAGLVRYGQIIRLDFVDNDSLVLKLDEPAKLGDRTFSEVAIDVKSGYLKDYAGGEIDLIGIIPHDLPRLQECHANMLNVFFSKLKSEMDYISLPLEE